MQPSKKSDVLSDMLEIMFGRSTAIRNNRCVPAPIGCGGPAGPVFRDTKSAKEYMISGLCQNCQDEFFKGEDD